MPNLIPEKKSLLSLTVSILREHIEKGQWGEYLPPEVELANRMQIGRNTLRKALAQLTREGLIEPGRSGKRRKIIAPCPHQKKSTAKHPVYFLSPHSPDSLSSLVLHQVDEARLHLQEAGYRLQPITSKAFHLKQPEKVLNRLIDEHPAAAWILHCSTKRMQRVFMGRPGLTSIILGMPQPDIALPAVTRDVSAATRHAAGVLLGKGHRAICLLRAETGLAGSEEAERGFSEAFTRHPDDGALTPMIQAAPMEINGLCRVLSRLFSSRNPPTALIVEKVALVPSVMTHLAQLGKTIPRDVSLISLFEDPVLEYLVPEVAHYRINTRMEVKKLISLLLPTLKRGHASAQVKTLMPDFIPGKSVTPP